MSLIPPLHHGVGLPFYAGLKICAQLETPTYHLYLIPHRSHYKLGYGTAKRLPNPYGEHLQTLMQCNEETCNQIKVSSPVGGGS